VRTEQYQGGQYEDVEKAALDVQHQVTILAKYDPGPQQERGPDDQGLSDEQDQSTDWVIDIEEPDQLVLGSSSL
jgi:hypothetical protein